MNHLTPLSLLAALVTPTALAAQMEMRWSDQYAGSEFAKADPEVYSAAPDLQLWDLDGRPRSLALERGRTVVLIGGSYT